MNLHNHLLVHNYFLLD